MQVSLSSLNPLKLHTRHEDTESDTPKDIPDHEDFNRLSGEVNGGDASLVQKYSKNEFSETESLDSKTGN